MSWLTKSFVQTVTGEGISENIREAYGFLCNNYEPGDEIYLLGFSRGAFTARSIAGLIADVGLMTRVGMVDFYATFKDWENQLVKGYVSPWPNQPFPNKPLFLDPNYVKELEEVGEDFHTINNDSLTKSEARSDTAPDSCQSYWGLGDRR